MKETEKVLKELIDKSFSEFNLVQGSLVKASVLEIGKKGVTLDVGFKSEGLVPLEEFQEHKNGIEIEEGEETEVILEALEEGFGEIRLSREKGRKKGNRGKG
jgi:Ribosomal protein S1